MHIRRSGRTGSSCFVAFNLYSTLLLAFFVFLTRFVHFEVTGRLQEPILTAYEKRQGTVNWEHLGVQYLAQEYLSGRVGLLFRIKFKEFRLNRILDKFRPSRVFVTAGTLGLKDHMQ